VTSPLFDGPGTVVLFPSGERDFSLLHNVQISSGANQASYTVDTGGSLPRTKEAEA
jgi:hypothetical protein